ncbi:sodium:proton antiporter NhaD [Fulvivirga sp. 29W222]|uniref:Sodium:proton antiporter NhaD n=1 Tax=Fulvivirga marina TaxID=2494733 RepID=A0A937FXV0_9BACT|nr:sodium:proton antiporter NhaD [Fulvivirga marina]MBL6444926.1 sodium:proton antiporter NhaD [Fulvivirga marina]
MYDSESVLLIIIFIVGFAAIAFEHNLQVNKSWIALFTGSIMWIVVAIGEDEEVLREAILHESAEIFALIVFLMGAMTIVEMMAHFRFFTWVESKLLILKISDRQLFWLMGLTTFMASALLDNLTSTLIMIQIGRHLYIKKRNFVIYVINIVIAANAGGAMSPVGDVTTIMLWLAGKFTAWQILFYGLIPSIIAWIVPQAMLTLKITNEDRKSRESKEVLPLQWSIIFIGLFTFGFAVIVNLFHLPPFIGILLGLGACAIVIDYRLKQGTLKKRAGHIVNIIKTIDMATLNFFIGILLAVGALNYQGVLHDIALLIFGDNPASNPLAIIIGHTSLGLFSAVVDNVPLTAAVIKMLPEGITFTYWVLLAITAGTGGSILIIGSAAGVAAMGQVKELTIIRYIKLGTLPALIGYLTSVASWYLLFGTTG